MAAVTAAVLALSASGLCASVGCSIPSPARPKLEPEPEPEPEAACLLPLTVIVTTSPCRGGAAVHCALLRALFASFSHLPGLNETRILLVCDGYKLAKTGGKVRLKGVRFASCGFATSSLSVSPSLSVSLSLSLSVSLSRSLCLSAACLYTRCNVAMG